MKCNEINIEDIVRENDSAWSQVCEECASKLKFENCNEEIPLDKFVCGIQNCQNTAVFYLEIKNEIIDENKI
jgi:hypothetical protein